MLHIPGYRHRSLVIVYQRMRCRKIMLFVSINGNEIVLSRTTNWCYCHTCYLIFRHLRDQASHFQLLLIYRVKLKHEPIFHDFYLKNIVLYQIYHNSRVCNYHPPRLSPGYNQCILSLPVPASSICLY